MVVEATNGARLKTRTRWHEPIKSGCASDPPSTRPASAGGSLAHCPARGCECAGQRLRPRQRANAGSAESRRTRDCRTASQPIRRRASGPPRPSRSGHARLSLRARRSEVGRHHHCHGCNTCPGALGCDHVLGPARIQTDLDPAHFCEEHLYPRPILLSPRTVGGADTGLHRYI